MKHTGIKIFAPASIGNLGVGFDIMGCALEKPGDEIVIRWSTEPGFRITQITGAQGRLPTDPALNTAGVAALELLKNVDADLLEGRGIEMEIHKKMPFNSGLGSSAASAVGGAMAVNELLRRPFTKRELLPFAMAGEQLASGGFHADNVAPSLLGGIQFIRDNDTFDIHRVHSPRGIYLAVIHPHVEVSTKAARAILSKELSLRQHITQSANLGAFIMGMSTGNIDLIGRSLRDVVIEPQRAALVPKFYEVQEAAMTAGALGCTISGAGPSIFAMCANSLIAEQVGEAMQKVFAAAKIKSGLYLSPINHEGAVLC